MRRRVQRTAGAVALIVGAAALSGCAVDVVDTPQPFRSTVVTPDSDPESDVASEPLPDDPAQYPRRSYWASRITVTTGCPTGEIVIAGDDQNVLVSGDCQRIVLRGSYTNVIAQRVGTLVIEPDADDGVVLLKSADTIDIKGDYAEVYWDEGNPGVTMDGDSTANPNPMKE